MRRYRGGDTVNPGYYWNWERWEMTFVERDGGLLPGGFEQHYLRLPVGLMLLAAPIMGLLFVMFLPFIGIALLLHHMAVATGQYVREAAEGLMGTITPAWRPGVAFLAGKAKARKAQDEQAAAETPDRLEALQQEIEERRKNE